MPPLGDLLGKSLERLLRWVYPGVLLLGLLFLADINVFRKFDREFYVWVAVGFVWIAGFVIFTLQRFVVNEFITLLLDFRGWNSLPRANRRPFLDGPFPWLCSYIDRLAKSSGDRFGQTGETRAGKIGDYLNERWGISHAIAITAWLPWAVKPYAMPESPLLDNIPLLIGITVPLGLGYLLAHFTLERLTKQEFVDE